jgi:hypothetical protein
MPAIGDRFPAIADRPLFASYWEDLEQFSPARGSSYVYASSIEERSQLPETWLARHQETRFIQIAHRSSDEGTLTATLPDGESLTISLRSRSQLASLVDAMGAGRVYLDVTGLDHPAWAGILRALLIKRVETCAVYIEPKEYAYSLTPTEGEIFDLSERIRGLRPIPGFASLQSPTDDFLLVACLGFEGARFAYMVEQLQPDAANIVPLVGLPGFRPEYPFLAYWANKGPLSNTRSWRQVRFVRANCPFSMYYALSDLAKEHPQKAMRIAPIGTKPHAIGAVLFFLGAGGPHRNTEIVYDHPIRKAKRTAGASRVSLFHLSSFLPGI